MSAPLTSPLGGDDLAKALRDAYGRGFSESGEGWNAEYPGDVHETPNWQNERDVWIAQYMARLPAAEPIAAASDACVGGGAWQKAWGDLSPQETVRRVRCMADDAAAGTAIEAWRDACDAILKRLGGASAPSPEAGAGGDLDAEAKRIMDAAWPEYGGNNQSAEFWQAFDEAVGFTLKLIRSGKLVASTGSEEETKGADWRPIETAPKDGTSFLATHEKSGVRQITWFGKASHVPLYGWAHGDEAEDIDLWSPTHWMPLPAPPPFPEAALRTLQAGSEVC